MHNQYALSIMCWYVHLGQNTPVSMLPVPTPFISKVIFSSDFYSREY